MLADLDTRVSALERGEVAEDPREDIRQLRQALKAIRDQLAALGRRLDDAGIA